MRERFDVENRVRRGARSRLDHRLTTLPDLLAVASRFRQRTTSPLTCGRSCGATSRRVSKQLKHHTRDWLAMSMLGDEAQEAVKAFLKRSS